jgi:hypothetical protein
MSRLITARADFVEAAIMHRVTPDGCTEAMGPPAIEKAWRQHGTEEAETAYELLAKAERLKSRALAVNSYWLKHRLEDTVGGCLSNGSVILAAYMLGIRVWRLAGHVNANIGVRIKSPPKAGGNQEAG